MRGTAVSRIAAVTIVAAVAGFVPVVTPVVHADSARTYLDDAQQRLRQGDLRGAVIQLRNAVKNAPQNGEAHYQLAKLALELGDPILTEGEAQRALDLGYDPAASTALLAQAYLAESRPADILKNFQVESQYDPARAASVLVARGRAETALDDPAKAREAFTQAAQLVPHSAAPFVGLARLALAERNTAEAKDDLGRALAADPDARDALILQADVLAATGDRNGAIRRLDSLIAGSPADLLVRLARANMLLSAGEDAKARADVDTVLAYSPGNMLGLYLRAVLLVRAQDWQGADVALTRISGAIPRLPRGYYFLALAKAHLGQQEQALDAASRYAARNPGDADGAKLYAGLQMRANRPADAIQTLNRLVDAGNKDPGVYQLLGRAYAASGQIPQALHALQQAVQLAPQDAALRTELAAVQLGSGHSAAAKAELEHSLSLSPEQPHAEQLLVAAALNAGDLDRAAAALNALRPKDKSEQIGLLEGMLKLARLDFDGARQAFRVVLQTYPDSVRARLQLARLDIMQGRPDDATDEIAALLERNPTDATALSVLSDESLRRNHPDQAIALLRKAHQAAPGDTRLTAMLAQTYLQTGSPQQAADLLTSGNNASNAANDSAEPPILALLRAQTEVALKQPDQAEATYRAALAAHPDDIGIRLQFARFLMTRDEVAARKVVADGLARQPDNYVLLQADVSIERQAHGLDAALAEAAQLESDQAHQPAARYLKGDLLVQAKRYGDAAAAFAAVGQAVPGIYPVLQEASALSLAGQADRAAAVLRDWLTKHPMDMAAAQVLASLDIQETRLDEAEAQLQTVLAQQPDNAVALNNLAWIYQARGDGRAAALAIRAYMLAPGPQTADTLGWILTQQGNSAAGVALLRSASAATSNPQTDYHLAVALSRTGQQEQAVALLQHATASPGGFPEKPDAVRLLARLSAGQ